MKLRLVLESRSIRRFEVAPARRVDAYVVCSPIDQQVLERYHQDVKVDCIPNGVDTEYFSPNEQVAEKNTIVFTGAMEYGPNRDAARFLCLDILPRIRAMIPGVMVELVGSDPPADVRSLGGNGVTVTGTVVDVRPYIERATVFVSPLRFGTGVKNKVLAALAMGKAVVATSESCAGLTVNPGEHLLVANHPDDFAARIVELFRNESLRNSLGIAGRNLVVERYAWDGISRQIEALLEDLLVQARQPISNPN